MWFFKNHCSAEEGLGAVRTIKRKSKVIHHENTGRVAFCWVETTEHNRWDDVVDLGMKFRPHRERDMKSHVVEHNDKTTATLPLRNTQPYHDWSETPQSFSLNCWTLLSVPCYDWCKYTGSMDRHALLYVQWHGSLEAHKACMSHRSPMGVQHIHSQTGEHPLQSICPKLIHLTFSSCQKKSHHRLRSFTTTESFCPLQTNAFAIH